MAATSHAFTASLKRPVTTTPSITRVSSTAEAAEEQQQRQVITYIDDLVEAVDCASHFGKCDVRKLHELADKVDFAARDDECTFEIAMVNADLCDKEIQDRQDVANLLRLQAELRLGMEYLEKANLFAANVQDEHDIRDRDMEMEILSNDGI